MISRYAYVEMCCGIAGAIVDRITKWYARTHISGEVPITTWLSYQTEVNRGLSWSIGASDTPSTWYVITSLVFFVICICTAIAYRRISRNQPVYGLTCIIIGAISNSIDRLVYGGVIDWIVIHYHGWYWPTFNIADIMICCGVGLVLYRGDI